MIRRWNNMRSFFDEETDKKLLEAKNEEEVRAIIATTPEADKLADKIDLVMAEIQRIKGSVDEEISDEMIDSIAGGAKRKRIDLSPTQGCMATFRLQDWIEWLHPYCSSNDFCMATNEYDYHNTQFANCSAGGHHHIEYDYNWPDGYKCTKCSDILISGNKKPEDYNLWG